MATRVNVNDEGDVTRAVDENVKELNGRLDVFVANAGVPWTSGAAIDADVSNYHKIITTDLGTALHALESVEPFVQSFTDNSQTASTTAPSPRDVISAARSLKAPLRALPRMVTTMTASMVCQTEPPSSTTSPTGLSSPPRACLHTLSTSHSFRYDASLRLVFVFQEHRRAYQQPGRIQRRQSRRLTARQIPRHRVGQVRARQRRQSRLHCD